MSEDGTTPTVRLVAGDNAPGVADIVKRISVDVQQLVKGEIELAKAELIPSAKKAGTGAGLFGGAGVFALYGLGLLFIGLSWLIGEALGRIWLGFLIMTGGLFIVAGILALIGKAQLKQADFSATRTKDTATETVEAVKVAVAAVLPTADQRALTAPAQQAMDVRPGGGPAVR